MSTRFSSLKRQDLLEELQWAGRKASRASLLFRSAIAERAGLHVTDAECVDYLLEAGSATAGDLAKAAGLTTGAMTAAIDRLEKAGFVSRESDAKDRRKVIVKPVMSEIKKFVPLYDSFAQETNKLLSKYTLEELQLLIDHNNSLTEIYEHEIAKWQKKGK